MKETIFSRITGTGTFLPPKVMSNSDFESIVETSDEWIVTRTGIRERRIADAETFPSTMGAAAARTALEQANVAVSDVDLLIVATMSGDYPSPSTAALIQTALGLRNIPAMDVQAACTGFVYALATAKAYIESSLARCAVVIAAEKMSTLMDYKDRTTCVLFGDGAAAAVVQAEGDGLAIGNPRLGCDGAGADLVIVPGGGSRYPTSSETMEKGLHFFQMDGRELYKQVIRQAAQTALALLEEEGVAVSSLFRFIPHQANQRLMETMAKQLSLPRERICSVVEKYGNTSAAGIGIALHELVTSCDIAVGEKLLLSAFGGGLTWGSLLLTKIKG